jgi:predicted glutamine amidotransferase
MLIAIGDLDMHKLVDGLIYMAADKGKVTTKMVAELTDEEIKTDFLRRGPHHQDGWGIAYLKDYQFIIEKSIKPVFEDEKIEDVKKVQSNLVMLHARYKSIGEITLKNVHPFQYKDFVYCHNGTVKKEIPYDKEKFPEEAETDSERIFYSILSKNLPLPEAIKKTFSDIELKPNSNIILANKEKTYVYSSSRTIPDYLTMQIGTNQDLIVVSSEKFPSIEVQWQELPFEKVLIIDNQTKEFEFY